MHINVRLKGLETTELNFGWQIHCWQSYFHSLFVRLRFNSWLHCCRDQLHKVLSVKKCPPKFHVIFPILKRQPLWFYACKKSLCNLKYISDWKSGTVISYSILRPPPLWQWISIVSMTCATKVICFMCPTYSKSNLNNTLLLSYCIFISPALLSFSFQFLDFVDMITSHMVRNVTIPKQFMYSVIQHMSSVCLRLISWP